MNTILAISWREQVTFADIISALN